MNSRLDLPWPAAALLLTCSAFGAAAYALNPTGRYLIEMSRLIRDPQLQRSSMNSVAAPLRPEETEPGVTMDEELEYDIDVPPFPDDLRSSSSVFDGPIPTLARRKMLEVTMESLDDSTPDAGYDLFDALDRHLRALDEQIETSSSLSNALNEQLPSHEMDYIADESEPSDNIEEIDMSYTQTDPTFYEEPTDFVILPADDGTDSEMKSSVDGSIQPQPNFYDETNVDSYQPKNNPNIIGTDSFGFSTIHAQAVHSFETYQPKKAKFVAIQHMEGPPPLPDTTDPYELLGFSYHNPPKDADDIRRAYVKRAKKYHPDAIHPASNDEERELAAKNFKRINDAYRKLKDDEFRLQNEFFATTMGGAMYEPRGSSRHIRRPFSYGRDFDDSESMFSGSYSARHGAKYGETQRFWEKRKANAYKEKMKNEQRSSNGNKKRSPFARRHEVRHNCHVSGDQFPPFFSH